MVVGIVRLRSLRVILRVHGFLPSLQDPDTQPRHGHNVILSGRDNENATQWLESCAKHNHWPEKTVVVQLMFCLVGTARAVGHKNPRSAHWNYTQVNRGNGGCIWAILRTCFLYQVVSSWDRECKSTWTATCTQGWLGEYPHICVASECASNVIYEHKKSLYNTTKCILLEWYKTHCPAPNLDNDRGMWSSDVQPW